MLTIRKHGSLFIVEWEGMDIEFSELSKALIFIETIFKFAAMEVSYSELVEKAVAYDEIMRKENRIVSATRHHEF